MPFDGFEDYRKFGKVEIKSHQILSQFTIIGIGRLCGKVEIVNCRRGVFGTFW
jgi:hypothetical protein